MTERMSIEEYKKAKKWNKYGNKKTEVDGILFDSKREAERYKELRLLEKAGAIEGLKLQVPFELIPAQADEKAVKYIADFVYLEQDRTVVEDVKSEPTKTKVYIVKRKLFKRQYPGIEFREV